MNGLDHLCGPVVNLTIKSVHKLSVWLAALKRKDRLIDIAEIATEFWQAQNRFLQAESGLGLAHLVASESWTLKIF